MNAFQKFEIFRGLAPDEAVTVRGIAQEVRVAAGGEVFAEGAAGDSAYLLMTGQVEVRKRTGSGERTLATLSAGSVVGEMALLSRVPRAAAVVAAGDAKLLKITQAAFQELADAHPRIAVKIYANMARSLADRLRALDEEFARGAAGSPAAAAPGLKEFTTLLTRSSL